MASFFIDPISSICITTCLLQVIFQNNNNIQNALYLPKFRQWIQPAEHQRAFQMQMDLIE